MTINPFQVKEHWRATYNTHEMTFQPTQALIQKTKFAMYTVGNARHASLFPKREGIA